MNFFIVKQNYEYGLPFEFSCTKIEAESLDDAIVKYGNTLDRSEYYDGMEDEILIANNIKGENCQKFLLCCEIITKFSIKEISNLNYK